ncbi:hypothetical protein C8J57DRAFT_1250096 [Mycena rebaudengoi]|nr:hypothetical protein C8J57DRAFT_1250096 [Mycena rebaudengoi]
MARKKAARQRATFSQQNAWNRDHPVAGPSRIQLPISSQPQTLSQILATQQNTYAFPQSERGGAPLYPPRWVIDQNALNHGASRNDEPYAAVRNTPHGSARPRTSGPPTPPQYLPLENLDTQIMHDSPRLQTRFLTRPIGELTPHTPHSHDHRDKRTQIPQSSPSSPSQPERSVMENDLHLEFVPQLLFRDRQDHPRNSPGVDVFGSIQSDNEPPPQSQSPSPSPLPEPPPGELWIPSPHHVRDISVGSLIQCIHTYCGAQKLVIGSIEISLEHSQQLEDQINLDPPLPSIPPLMEPDAAAPNIPPNPLAESAVSAADRALMSKVRDEWMKVEVETCSSCHERWFDLEIQDGKCGKC